MNACLVALSLLLAQSAAARRVAREVVESFGREAVEAAEPRVVRLVEAYGEEAATVLRRVGPPASRPWSASGLRGFASSPASGTTASGSSRSRGRRRSRRSPATATR